MILDEEYKIDSSTNRDEKTVQLVEEEHHSSVLEYAPYSALGSLEEIVQTISRTRTNQSDDLTKEDTEQEIFKHQPYHTEGIRNPGWLSVISCFFVNFFVFGTVFAWGNYQKLYVTEVYTGRTDLFKIAFVGTSSCALILALGLFITPVIQKIGFRGTMAIGTIVSPLGLILASFATELWHTYLSQGILFGLGAAFVFSPSVTLPSQWFTTKRALATGLAVSGSGIGGVCLSPMTQNLISHIGYRNSLRVHGVFGFALLCISTGLATSRYRPPPVPGNNNKWYHLIDMHLLDRKFALLLGFSFFVAFGYVAPLFLAPQFVEHLGLNAASGAVMISVMSAMNALCRISLGYLADRLGKFNTMFACTFLAGAFAMIIWQLSTSYGTFAAFCILYGLTAGGFVSLLPVTTADIVGIENIQRGVDMAYMVTVFGNLLGSPIIGRLYDAYGWTAAIQFAGSVTMASAIILFILRMKMSKETKRRQQSRQSINRLSRAFETTHLDKPTLPSKPPSLREKRIDEASLTFNDIRAKFQNESNIPIQPKIIYRPPIPLKPSKTGPTLPEKVIMPARTGPPSLPVKPKLKADESRSREREPPSVIPRTETGNSSIVSTSSTTSSQNSFKRGWHTNMISNWFNNTNNSHQQQQETLRNSIRRPPETLDLTVSPQLTGSKRKNIMTELLETERNYQKDMLLLRDIYYEQALLCLPKSDVRHLFSNLLDIVEFEKSFVAVLEHSCEQDSIGTAFRESMRAIDHIYSEYCKKHEDAVLKLQELKSQVETQTFLSKCQEQIQGKTTSWDLGSLLIKPVQRVLKYPLLLREILALTSPEHLDHDDLASALKEIEDKSV
ncbi:hypothetical protein G6F22_001282 [Rhizopus arrhizus]|nr:hypothetical protein G6F22_001282 [Rhizopus arrhizus]